MFPTEVKLWGIDEQWHTALWDAAATTRLFQRWLSGMEALLDEGSSAEDEADEEERIDEDDGLEDE
jgi:hypothetical protein